MRSGGGSIEALRRRLGCIYPSEARLHLSAAGWVAIVRRRRGCNSSAQARLQLTRLPVQKVLAFRLDQVLRNPLS